jgi:thioredoxin reductase
MTAQQLEHVPGARRLLGRGVHVTLPDDLTPLASHEVVVAGDMAAAAPAALRLGDHGCRATLTTPADGRRASAVPATVRHQLRANANVTLVYGTEVTWAVGLDHLETVILRHVPSGRVEVRNAAALFLLSTRPVSEP